MQTLWGPAGGGAGAGGAGTPPPPPPPPPPVGLGDAHPPYSGLNVFISFSYRILSACAFFS